jgi:hypothetical protein
MAYFNAYGPRPVRDAAQGNVAADPTAPLRGMAA